MSQIRPIEDLFAELIELKTAAERQAFLAERCGEDEALRKQLEKLFAAYEKAGSFLAPTDEIDPTAGVNGEDLSGQQVGPYRIRERLGCGGMGVVWAAEQKKPLHRKVALKLIKPGMDTAQVIARFEAERAALALMDHPNIARVIDAGTTEQGRPYFVMELIRGVPITEYCDARRLTVRQRLSLFMQVCKAVQHAHQKGIIHRDIKPSNVLITEQDGEPVPKVIDFGVAKALHQPLTERSLYSGVFQAIGTLAYMSPEQAGLSTSDVDTRADIYGLGVLLYELLTGSTPFEKEELASAAFDEACRIIREKDPPKPSTRISTLGQRAADAGRNRGVDPQGLGRIVRGDLDWIVSKALEKDRRRRYESADAFAADIHKHLSSEPVDARPPSTGYRLSRFYRRNKVLVTSVTTILFVLIASCVCTTWALLGTIKANRALSALAFDAALDAAMNVELDRVASMIRVMEKAGSSRAEIREIKGLVSFVNGDFDTAVALLEQDRDEDFSVLATSILVRAHYWAGNKDRSQALLTELKAMTPNNDCEMVLRAYAMNAIDARNQQEITEVLDKKPGWAIVRLLYGADLFAQSRDSREFSKAMKAVNELQQADVILVKNRFADAALLNAAHWALQLAREEQSPEVSRLENLCLTVVEEIPDDWKHMAAALYEYLGEVEQARQAWETWRIENDSIDTPQRIRYVAYLLRSASLSDGISTSELEDLLKLEELGPWTQIAKCLALIGRGETKQAHEIAKTLFDDNSLQDPLARTLALNSIAAFSSKDARVIAKELVQGPGQQEISGEHLFVWQFLASERRSDEALLEECGLSPQKLCRGHLMLAMKHLGNKGEFKSAFDHFARVEELQLQNSIEFDWGTALLARLQADPELLREPE